MSYLCAVDAPRKNPHEVINVDVNNNRRFDERTDQIYISDLLKYLP